MKMVLFVQMDEEEQEEEEEEEEEKKMMMTMMGVRLVKLMIVKAVM
jgi:hypothetical protein